MFNPVYKLLFIALIKTTEVYYIWSHFPLNTECRKAPVVGILKYAFENKHQLKLVF